MTRKNAIKLFENKKIRTLWEENEEEWFFSIIDVIAVLTDSKNPRRYWSDLKNKMKSEEGSELYENIVQLKMPAADGKMRLTDVANTKQLLRFILSIPSPKAESFKLWLAEVGKERLDEIADPELTIERAMNTYKAKGYSDDWINQRLKSIEIRKELTDEWQRCDHTLSLGSIKLNSEEGIIDYFSGMFDDFIISLVTTSFNGFNLIDFPPSPFQYREM